MRAIRLTALALALPLGGPSHAQDLRCAPPPYDQLPELFETLSALAPVMAEFPALDRALTDRVREICISPRLRDAQGYFEPETDRLVLSERLPPGLQQAVLIHEIRHAQQYGLGNCPSRDLAMTDYAQAIFAMEADASVASLVVATFLLDRGQPQMWQALVDWPMQRDTAQVFEQSLADTGQISTAASDAFDAWFDNPARREAYYVASCLDYLDQSESDHRLPRYESLSADFYDQLCRLPDGRSYACTAPD